MKKIIIIGLSLLVVATGIFFVVKMVGDSNSVDQKERYDKLLLVAKQINEEIEEEVKDGEKIVDSKPGVGSDKATVTKLKELVEEYGKQVIDIPEDKEYSDKELEKHINSLEKGINNIDKDLLKNLKFDDSDMETLKKLVSDKEKFDKTFSEKSNILVKYNGIKEQINVVNEAVKKETKRVADEKAKKAAEAKKAAAKKAEADKKAEAARKAEAAKKANELAKKKAQCEKDFGWWENGQCMYGGMGKPVLYLYPTMKTNIRVNFENPSLLTTTYPKFINIWEVTAYPNGDLYDKANKYYYALYWEENLIRKIDFKTGFYVEGKDAIKFLEEKLTIIGLNARERNEFIMYWLPILEKNEKNLVYFELTKEKQEDNKLIITPKPDSLLRMTIHVKKVSKKTYINEQKLNPFKRVGFVAVEWGGINY